MENQLSPLYVVVNRDVKTRLTFDFTKFISPEGQYEIRDVKNGDLLLQFDGKKNIRTLEFLPKKSGLYGIIKDSDIIGVVEVVDDLKTVDVEKIKEELFRVNQ